MTKRRITDDERRARVGIRHRLAHGTRASTLADAAASMVVLHATDAASVFLEARARMAESSPPAIEHAMYDEPTALRLLAMRRTLFLVPLADVPMVHAAASRAIGETERRRTIGMLAEAGIGPDPARHLQELEAVGLAAVRERGESTTAELRALDPRLDERITLARGKAREIHQRRDQGLLPPCARWPHRSREAKGHMDRRPVPLEPHRAMAARWDRRASRRRIGPMRVTGSFPTPLEIETRAT